MIRATQLITGTDEVSFQTRLSHAIRYFQGETTAAPISDPNPPEIEVQFSTARRGDYGVSYSALVIVRTP